MSGFSQFKPQGRLLVNSRVYLAFEMEKGRGGGRCSDRKAINRGRIFKLLRSSRIDSKESIPPSNLARAGIVKLSWSPRIDSASLQWARKVYAAAAEN
jgi:hypothetical protein